MADPSSGGGDMVMREYRKGNWTVSETLVLMEAKKMDEERRVRGSIVPPAKKQPQSRNKPAELRWKWIEEYCWRKGCLRNQNQCNDKWDNLMRDYKKIREYERSWVESSFETASSCLLASYWQMEKSERKEKQLPSNMLSQIYEALANLVEKKSLPSSLASAAVGSNNSGQILSVYQQSLGFEAPMMAQPMNQIPATIVLPLQPSPQPQRLVLSHPLLPQPPLFTLHAEPIHPTVVVAPDSNTREYSDISPAAKRRRTTPEETTAVANKDAEDIEVEVALSRSASVIAQVIRESEERQERRHKEVMKLQDRRLRIEESKAEIRRQATTGLVDAINNLTTSILALASSSRCHNNLNHQGAAP